MTEHSIEEIEDRLWAEIDKGRFGMLGLSGSRMHFQPMTAFAEKVDGKIWFFTHRDTDLARRVGDGAQAMFIVQAKDQDLQACVGGLLVEDRDRDRIDKYWDPMIAAWFPEGKQDEGLTLLRLDCHDAQVWLTEAGPLKYAWEVARSNLKGERPDLGEQRHLDLH
ncbi:MAG TPA: pyridoxamine 5'-phosphate oxidase family protein [Caulobacteraceae bacterium]|jgi:general stress protein 26|nr:pyridoxamine 5'-phosphate oxidase family protein [Caulobacteraceae bacterium]